MSEQISVLVKMGEDGQIVHVKLPGRGRTPKDYVRTTMSQEEFDRYSGSSTVEVEAKPPKKKGKKRGRKSKKDLDEQAKDKQETKSETEDDDVFLPPDPDPDLDDLSDVKTIKAKKTALWSTLLKGMHYLTRKTHGEEGEVVEVLAVTTTSHLEDVNDFLSFNQTLAKVVGNLKTGDLHIYKMDDKADVPDLIIQGAIEDPKTVTKSLLVSVTRVFDTKNNKLIEEEFVPPSSNQNILYFDNLGGPLEPYYVRKYNLLKA